MSEQVVAVEGLERRFHGDPLRQLLRRGAPPLHVLRGVDLEVRAGEWVAVMGGNGTGKTTLLKIIAGLLEPSAGSVRVLDRDVSRDRKAARAAVGYALADERSFHWRLTSRQNLEFFAALEQLHGRDRRARIDGLLERLDLAGDAERPFFQLSTGMRQRLALARALLKQPRVLLMDEPTRSVDAVHANAIWPLVREELEAIDGCAILVTHFARDALQQCDRVTSLENGRLHEWSGEHPAARQNGGARRELTMTVRELRPEVAEVLRGLRGVTDLRVRPGPAGEQVLEVAAEDGAFDLSGLFDLLARSGATLCSLEATSGSDPERAPASAGRSR